MRKHLYLITEHDTDDYVGAIKTTDHRLETGEKNVETPIRTIDKEAGEFPIVGQQVHLGYADFKDEDDLQARFNEVIAEKLAEIDERHLEKAGVDGMEAEA